MCGKTPETTVLQDLLTYSVKGLSCWATWAKAQGVAVPREVYSFLHSATFACLTNVNFDDARFKARRGGVTDRQKSSHTDRRAQCPAPPPRRSVLPCCPPCLQEYVTTAHRLVDELEAACRAAGVEGAPPAADGLPQFDLLSHPARWRLDQAYLNSASLQQLTALGQMTRWAWGGGRGASAAPASCNRSVRGCPAPCLHWAASPSAPPPPLSLPYPSAPPTQPGAPAPQGGAHGAGPAGDADLRPARPLRLHAPR